MKMLSRPTRKSPNLDQEIEANYTMAVNTSRKIWYSWIDPIVANLRPIVICTILLAIINVVEGFWIHDLAIKTREAGVFLTVIDPTKTKVIETIQLDAKPIAVDQAAEMAMVKTWVTDLFSVTSDAKAARAQKRRARFRVKANSPAQTKVDAFYVQNDPIKLGANGTIDVDSSITPLLGEHHYSIDGTRQPYDLVGKAQVSQTFKCDILLTYVPPTTKQEATEYYPYTFVKDYTCTDN